MAFKGPLWFKWFYNPAPKQRWGCGGRHLANKAIFRACVILGSYVMTVTPRGYGCWGWTGQDGMGWMDGCILYCHRVCWGEIESWGCGRERESEAGLLKSVSWGFFEMHLCKLYCSLYNTVSVGARVFPLTHFSVHCLNTVYRSPSEMQFLLSPWEKSSYP